MKHISVALILLLVLAGCQTNPTKKSISQEKSQQSKQYKSDRGFQYEPGTNEEFVLKQLTPWEQKRGYSQLCSDTKNFVCEPLPYEKYKGMKGFFLSMEPARVDYSGYEFRRVVLQSGKRFFYVSNDNYGGIYTKQSPIQRVSSIESRIGKPISPNSTITIKDTKEIDGRLFVNLSNGVQIKGAQFTAFIKIIATVTNPEHLDELTRLLSKLELIHDIAKDRIVIHYIKTKTHPLQAYIIDKNGKLSLLIRHQYVAKKWLHARSFALLVGKEQYKSTRLSFKTKERHENKREWYDVEPKADYLKILSAAVYAEKATLRFYSDKFFVDQALSFSNKVRLKQTLRCYQLLK
jgi:hypothetical protein